MIQLASTEIMKLTITKKVKPKKDEEEKSANEVLKSKLQDLKGETNEEKEK